MVKSFASPKIFQNSMICKPPVLTEYQSKHWNFDQDFFQKSLKTSKMRIQELQQVTTLEGKKAQNSHNVIYFSYVISVFVKCNDFIMEEISRFESLFL